MMELNINSQVLLLLIGITTAMAMTAIGLIFHGQKKQKQTLYLIGKINREMTMLSMGSIGVGKKIVEIENRFRGLLQRQETIESQDESRSAYEQASKLLEKGLSCEDVAKTCHIAPAEAALLLVLNKKQDI